MRCRKRQRELVLQRVNVPDHCCLVSLSIAKGRREPSRSLVFHPEDPLACLGIPRNRTAQAREARGAFDAGYATRASPWPIPRSPQMSGSARSMRQLRDQRTVTGIFNETHLACGFSVKWTRSFFGRSWEMPPPTLATAAGMACIQVQRPRGSLAAERIAEFPKKLCAVTPPRAAMHACECRRFGRREFFQLSSRIVAVRKVIHLPPECFARTENVPLGDGRKARSSLGKEIST